MLVMLKYDNLKYVHIFSLTFDGFTLEHLYSEANIRYKT